MPSSDIDFDMHFCFDCIFSFRYRLLNHALLMRQLTGHIGFIEVSFSSISRRITSFTRLWNLLRKISRRRVISHSIISSPEANWFKCLLYERALSRVTIAGPSRISSAFSLLVDVSCHYIVRWLSTMHAAIYLNNFIYLCFCARRLGHHRQIDILSYHCYHGS